MQGTLGDNDSVLSQDSVALSDEALFSDDDSHLGKTEKVLGLERELMSRKIEFDILSHRNELMQRQLSNKDQTLTQINEQVGRLHHQLQLRQARENDYVQKIRLLKRALELPPSQPVETVDPIAPSALPSTLSSVGVGSSSIPTAIGIGVGGSAVANAAGSIGSGSNSGGVATVATTLDSGTQVRMTPAMLVTSSKRQTMDDSGVGRVIEEPHSSQQSSVLMDFKSYPLSRNGGVVGAAAAGGSSSSSSGNAASKGASGVGTGTTSTSQIDMMRSMIDDSVRKALGLPPARDDDAPLRGSGAAAQSSRATGLLASSSHVPMVDPGIEDDTKHGYFADPTGDSVSEHSLLGPDDIVDGADFVSGAASEAERAALSGHPRTSVPLSSTDINGTPTRISTLARSQNDGVFSVLSSLKQTLRECMKQLSSEHQLQNRELIRKEMGEMRQSLLDSNAESVSVLKNCTNEFKDHLTVTLKQYSSSILKRMQPIHAELQLIRDSLALVSQNTDQACQSINEQQRQLLEYRQTQAEMSHGSKGSMESQELNNLYLRITQLIDKQSNEFNEQMSKLRSEFQARSPSAKSRSRKADKIAAIVSDAAADADLLSPLTQRFESDFSSPLKRQNATTADENSEDSSSVQFEQVNSSIRTLNDKLANQYKLNTQILERFKQLYDKGQISYNAHIDWLKKFERKTSGRFDEVKTSMRAEMCDLAQNLTKTTTLAVNSAVNTAVKTTLAAQSANVTPSRSKPAATQSASYSYSLSPPRVRGSDLKKKSIRKPRESHTPTLLRHDHQLGDVPSIDSENEEEFPMRRDHRHSRNPSIHRDRVFGRMKKEEEEEEDEEQLESVQIKIDPMTVVSELRGLMENLKKDLLSEKQSDSKVNRQLSESVQGCLADMKEIQVSNLQRLTHSLDQRNAAIRSAINETANAVCESVRQLYPLDQQKESLSTMLDERTLQRVVSGILEIKLDGLMDGMRGMLENNNSKITGEVSTMFQQQKYQVLLGEKEASLTPRRVSSRRSKLSPLHQRPDEIMRSPMSDHSPSLLKKSNDEVIPLISKMMEQNMQKISEETERQLQKWSEALSSSHSVALQKSSAKVSAHTDAVSDRVNIIDQMLREVVLSDLNGVRQMCSDMHKFHLQMPHILARAEDLHRIEMLISETMMTKLNEMKGDNLKTEPLTAKMENVDDMSSPPPLSLHRGTLRMNPVLKMVTLPEFIADSLRVDDPHAIIAVLCVIAFGSVALKSHSSAQTKHRLTQLSPLVSSSLRSDKNPAHSSLLVSSPDDDNDDNHSLQDVMECPTKSTDSSAVRDSMNSCDSDDLKLKELNHNTTKSRTESLKNASLSPQLVIQPVEFGESSDSSSSSVNASDDENENDEQQRKHSSLSNNDGSNVAIDESVNLVPLDLQPSMDDDPPTVANKVRMRALRLYRACLASQCESKADQSGVQRGLRMTHAFAEALTWLTQLQMGEEPVRSCVALQMGPVDSSALQSGAYLSSVLAYQNAMNSLDMRSEMESGQSQAVSDMRSGLERVSWKVASMDLWGKLAVFVFSVVSIVLFLLGYANAHHLILSSQSNPYW